MSYELIHRKNTAHAQCDSDCDATETVTADSFINCF